MTVWHDEENYTSQKKELKGISDSLLQSRTFISSTDTKLRWYILYIDMNGGEGQE